MNRRSLREQVFKLLFRVEFIEKEIGCPVYAIENGIPLLDQIETLLNGR